MCVLLGKAFLEHWSCWEAVGISRGLWLLLMFCGGLNAYSKGLKVCMNSGWKWKIVTAVWKYKGVNPLPVRPKKHDTWSLSHLFFLSEISFFLENKPRHSKLKYRKNKLKDKRRRLWVQYAWCRDEKQKMAHSNERFQRPLSPRKIKNGKRNQNHPRNEKRKNPKGFNSVRIINFFVPL